MKNTNIRCTVWIEKQDAEKFKAIARERGLSLSSWLRVFMLEKIKEAAKEKK